jgi:hypothetical protein
MNEDTDALPACTTLHGVIAVAAGGVRAINVIFGYGAACILVWRSTSVGQFAATGTWVYLWGHFLLPQRESRRRPCSWRSWPRVWGSHYPVAVGRLVHGSYFELFRGRTGVAVLGAVPLCTGCFSQTLHFSRPLYVYVSYSAHKQLLSP